MCVILDIQPGAMIPDDKLEIACDINGDGFGIAYIENGSFKVIRSLEKPNNPKTVKGLLEAAKAHRRFVHLRFATVGGVTLENNHPMVVLGKPDKPKMLMMHNGTLQSYKVDKSPVSDTFHFNERLVKPLAERVAAFKKPKDVLGDGIFQYIVEKESGYSLFLFADVFGNVFKVGEWVEYDGFSASNKYSFQTTHHRSSKAVVPYTPYRYPEYRRGQRIGDTKWTPPWKEVTPERTAVVTSMADWERENRSLNVVASYPHTSNAKAYRKEILQVRKYIAEHKYTEDKMDIIRNLKVKRTNVLQQFGQPDFSFLERLTTDDLQTLITRNPVAMTQCLFELVVSNRELVVKNETQAQTIKDLTEKK